MGICFFGAGGRTRTGTLSPAVDFESTTSTNSITPAGVNSILLCLTLLHHRPFAVPDKIFGLTPFLDFIDRGTHCAFASSATGSAQARGHHTGKCVFWYFGIIQHPFQNSKGKFYLRRKKQIPHSGCLLFLQAL